MSPGRQDVMFVSAVSTAKSFLIYIEVFIVTTHVAVTICISSQCIIITVDELTNIKSVQYGTSYLIQ